MVDDDDDDDDEDDEPPEDEEDFDWDDDDPFDEEEHEEEARCGDRVLCVARAQAQSHVDGQNRRRTRCAVPRRPDQSPGRRVPSQFRAGS